MPLLLTKPSASVPRLSDDVSPGSDALDYRVFPDHWEQLLILRELPGIRAAAGDVELGNNSARSNSRATQQILALRLGLKQRRL